MWKYLCLGGLAGGFVGAFVYSFRNHFMMGISFYGVMMIMYFIIQIISSKKNHERNKQHLKEDIDHNKRTFYDRTDRIITEHPFFNVLVMVGHRERRDYWERALMSITRLDRTNTLKIYIMIDGNEEEDDYMKDMAENILYPLDTRYEIIAISKRGKRGTMFFSFEKIRKDFPGMERRIDVVVSDSDTDLEEKCLIRLQECLQSCPRNGCATGLLGIYNRQDGILPKMIHARYLYAFMIERASTSYYGCMTCCSGPISIYKLSCLNELITHKFVTQSFFTIPCEPGDDRHLTNLVLAQGYYARQTNLARADTEAPETWKRFLNQQLRWSRSFYREMYWQLKAIPKQSCYLSLVTVYEFLFPFFLLAWIINILYFRDNLMFLMNGFLISIGILMIRTCLLFLSMKSTDIFYNLLYYPVYMLFLLPTKLYAFMTVLNNQWVTAPRFKKVSVPISFHLLFLLGYNMMITGGLVRLLWIHISAHKNWLDIYSRWYN